MVNRLRGKMMCKVKWIIASTSVLLGLLCLVEGGVYASTFDPDLNYGVQGSVTFSTGQSQAQIGTSVLQPDGKLIVTGNRTTVTSGQPGAELFAQRYNIDGTPDAGFGNNGESRFSVRGKDAINMIVLQPDGKIVLAVSAQEPCTVVYYFFGGCNNSSGQNAPLVSAIVRLRADGALDTTLGGRGFVEATDFYGGYAVAVQPDGKLLLLGTNSVPRARIFNWRLARFNADGSLDTGFNGGQTVSSRCEAYGYSLFVQPDGKIVVGGDDGVFYSDQSVNPGFCIERHLSDGSYDPSFNQGLLRTNFGFNVELRALTALPDGKFLAVGRGIRMDNTASPTIYESGAISARYTANGVLDTSYGSGGKVFVPVADSFGFVNYVFTREVGIVVAGFEYNSSSGSSQPYRSTLVRLLPDGQVDTLFGVNGISRREFDADPLTGFLSDINYHWYLISKQTLPDLNIGGLIESFKVDHLDNDTTAVEYFNRVNGHYFVTVGQEVTTVDANADWMRSGQTFRVYFAAESEQVPVCRFFSQKFISHFYAVAGDECDIVKTNPDWRYEGNSFFVTSAIDGGTPVQSTCPSGTAPVYRLYNNAYLGAPNHRYTTCTSIRDTMMARGWNFEGVAMCVAAGSSDCTQDASGGGPNWR